MLPAALPTCMRQGYSSWHAGAVRVSTAAEPPPRLCTLPGQRGRDQTGGQCRRWAGGIEASPQPVSPRVSCAPTTMGVERGGAAALGTRLPHTAPRSVRKASCLQPALPPSGRAAAYQWPDSHYMHAIGPLHTMPQLRSTMARDSRPCGLYADTGSRRRAHLQRSCLEALQCGGESARGQAGNR